MEKHSKKNNAFEIKNITDNKNVLSKIYWKLDRKESTTDILIVDIQPTQLQQCLSF